jgi:hypothetical protein
LDLSALQRRRLSGEKGQAMVKVVEGLALSRQRHGQATSVVQRPVLVRQAAQVPGDHRIYLRRPALPVGPACCCKHPPPIIIPHQRARTLKAAQQLDGEERIAAGVVVQRLAEVRPQAVRLVVDVRLNEPPAIGLVQVMNLKN